MEGKWCVGRPPPTAPALVAATARADLDPLQAPSYTSTALGTLTGGTGSEAYGLNDHGQVVGRAWNAAGLERGFLWDGTVAELPQHSGWTQSRAEDINNEGEVAGSAYDTWWTQYGRGVVWGNDSGHTPTLIPLLLTTDGAPFNYDNGPAFGINDAGQVAGVAQSGAGQGNAAYFYDPATGIEYVGSFTTDAGRPYSYGRDVDETGQVVGRSIASVGVSHAFLWDGTTMHDLHDPAMSYTGEQAWAANDLGQVVGWSSIADESLHAFLYQNGVMWDLHELVGAEWAGAVSSYAYTINDSSQIAGYWVDGSDVSHAYLLDPVAADNPTVVDAGGPYAALWGDVLQLDASGSHDPDPGDTVDGWAWDLDNDGLYGTDDTDGYPWDAAAAEPTTEQPTFAIPAKGTAGWDWLSVHPIGLIVSVNGTWLDVADAAHSTITVVPEPASALLLAGCLAALIRRRRRGGGAA